MIREHINIAIPQTLQLSTEDFTQRYFYMEGNHYICTPFTISFLIFIFILNYEGNETIQIPASEPGVSELTSERTS